MKAAKLSASAAFSKIPGLAALAMTGLGAAGAQRATVKQGTPGSTAPPVRPPSLSEALHAMVATRAWLSVRQASLGLLLEAREARGGGSAPREIKSDEGVPSRTASSTREGPLMQVGADEINSGAVSAQAGSTELGVAGGANTQDRRCRAGDPGLSGRGVDVGRSREIDSPPQPTATPKEPRGAGRGSKRSLKRSAGGAEGDPKRKVEALSGEGSPAASPKGWPSE